MPQIPSTNDLLLTVVQQANDLRILGEIVDELRAENAALKAAADSNPQDQPIPLPRQQRRASTRRK